MKNILIIAVLLLCSTAYSQGISKSQMNDVKNRYVIQMRAQNGTLYDFADGVPIPDELQGGVLKEVKVMRNDLTTGGNATVSGQIRIVSSPNATTWTQSYSISSGVNGSNIVSYTPNTTIISSMKSFELTSNTAAMQVVNVVLVIEK